jgi:glycosyltransferase involved in cell wall biosynthesis
MECNIISQKILTISLVIPAYNEEKAIVLTIDGFRRELEILRVPYEIIVVNNNSTDATADIAAQHGAKVLKEVKQGYGYACIAGLREAKGQIVILTEADKTFKPQDIRKFLVYLEDEDIDMVLGTRTTLELVEEKAKMDWFLHWGNFFLAKLIQVQFWNKCRLTDVGCTFRAIKREALVKVIGEFRDGGTCFSPEMIICCLKFQLKIIELPIRYLERVGESKITANKRKSLVVGLKMLKLILSQRFWKKREPE